MSNQEKTNSADASKSSLHDESHSEKHETEVVVNSTAESEDAPAEGYPQGLHLVILVVAVNMAIFLASLDQTIIGTAIPKITDEFHGLRQVSWYGSAYFMCLGGFQSVWGKAMRFFPLKITFITTVLIFELGSLICGVSPNSTAFIVGRAIAGVGGAGITTGATVILALSAEPAKRPTLMGTMGLSYCLAFLLGPIVGGAFSESVTWRWCFYINLPIGGVSLALVYVFFKTPSTAKVEEATLSEKLRHMDPIGVMLAMGAIISFILALQYGGVSYAWNSSMVIGLLVGFVVILLTLAGWEYSQGDYAMLPRRLFQRRSLWAGSLFQFHFVGCYFLLLFYLPIYFQSINGDSAIMSGVHNLPMVISACLFIIMGGVAVEKTQFATPYMTGGAALATVATGLLYTLDVGTSTGRWVGYQILVGAALAFPFQNALNIVQSDTPPRDISTVTSSLYFFQILGGAFSISAAQSAFVNRLIHSLAVNAPGINPQKVIITGASELRAVFTAEQLPGVLQAYMDGLKAAFAVGIGMAGMAFIASFLSPWKRLYVKPGEGAAIA
ncbi:MFS gliotoxin efflux transporter glia [Decorospora gaudefroyi]|uniref:MFS gliotoxin efflux transporter glia n=1 Tax=Decorospora gaudefroyi TaxID=184978 RepID=A0A6A5K4M0_9PLEO|nr:MFS gliotoxin efflux transporter glia [Decorospora gaudefroyi]